VGSVIKRASTDGSVNPTPTETTYKVWISPIMLANAICVEVAVC